MAWLTRARALAAIVFLLWLAQQAHRPPIAEDLRLLALPEGVGDPIEPLDRRFQSALAALPPSGLVGYLSPTSREAYGGFYVAEYALAPRIIVPNTEPEFVIVPPEAVAPGEPAAVGSTSQDARLQGYLLYRSLGSGVRIFRRVR